MRTCQAVIELSAEEREELTGWSNSRSLPAGDVFKAKLILALADGKSYSTVEAELGTSRPTIARWKARFEEGRIAGLEGRHKGSQPRKATPAMQARLLKKTQQKPADGSTHWSCRKMAAAVGLSAATVYRIWSKARLKPHRLDRLDPVLPLSPGRAEKHGFEYYRHGTLSLYAALDVRSGKVHGKTASRHTSAEFIDFLSEVVRANPEPQEIHIVLDNLSAHKTNAVKEFLEQNPRVRFHFTPTYSSWLNQVEIWFAKIERDVLARGVFTSVTDLSRKIMKYIRAYAKSAKPFNWKYTDFRHRMVKK